MQQTTTPTTHYFSALIISAAILALSVLAALLPVAVQPANQQALPEHVQELHMVDTTRQRRAHETLLLLTAVAAIALMTVDRVRQSLQPLDHFLSRRPIGWRWAIVLGPLAIVALSLSKDRWVVLALGSLGALVIAAQHFGYRKWFVTLLWISLLTYGGLVLLPGLLLPVDLTAFSFPAGLVEVHYGVAVSQGDRLSLGLRLFSNFSPSYGLLEPQILGLVEKLKGLSTFGAHVRLIQWTQVAFCLLAFLSYWIWSRRRILAITVTLIPILALAQTRQMSVFFPNQSGWRFCGLPLGMLLLVSARARPGRSAALLGIGFGGLLMFNPETGLVMGVAYAVFLFAECLQAQNRLKAVVTTFAGFLLATCLIPLLSIVSFRLSFGYFPFPDRSVDYALLKFAGGYGGLKLYFGVAWIVMLVHSLFELVHSAASIKTLTRRRRIRMSIAAAILVWFSYFINRPHQWDLWTIYFLYGFFVIDLIRPALFSRYITGIRGRRFVMGAAIVVMFVATNATGIADAALENLHAVRHRSNPSEASVRALSGVRLPTWYADLAESRAHFVKTRSQDGPVSYFTANGYLVPLLSGTFSNLPVSDPYEGYTVDDFERLAHWIESKGIHELLFDDPSAPLIGSAERSHYFLRLKERLRATYVRSARVQGWEIWERIDGQPIQGTPTRASGT